MAKLMLFIDGSWLYSNSGRLAENYGKKEFQIDFGKLPHILAREVGKQLGPTEVDIVRTYLFGSYPTNYDLRDDDSVQRRLDFYSMLKEEYHYELETFPINFRGRRIRRADRDPKDPFEAKEKCVDISLATSVMYFAAIPHAYDIAIAVIGDRDFSPVLYHVRLLGKRVAIASIKNSCPNEFSDPCDEARLKDFDIIWVDDLLHEVERKFERRQLLCESPLHKGDRKVWTTIQLRKGRKFYCDDCKAEHSKQKAEAVKEFVSSQVESISPSETLQSEETSRCLTGTVVKKVSDRGFGFIKTPDQKSYFFHFTDLASGQDFEKMQEGGKVIFEIEKEPSMDKAGTAKNVQWSNE